MKKANIFGAFFVLVCVLGTLIALRPECASRSCVGGPNETQESSAVVVREGGCGRFSDSRGSMLDLLVTIVCFGVADIVFFLWARHSIDAICKDSKKSNRLKLKALENEDVLFDLPLYLGLGGTVLGFLMIANGVSVSRDVAYVSTVLGIISSASMRVFLLRRRRSELIEETDEGRE